MKKIFLIMSLFSLSLISCEQNERMIYDAKAAIYFEQTLDTNNGKYNDSINYSFTMTTESFDTVYMRVRLLGNLKEDKYFNVEIDPKSNAIEGVHYKPLEESYLFKAGKVIRDIPIYVLKQDNLDTEFNSIIVNLVENDSFDIAYEKNIKTRLFITNQTVKPSYWDMPLAMYFGEYSKKKHEICVVLMGHDFPIKFDNRFQYYMVMGRRAALYFTINQIEDENGNIIQPWSPF